MAYRGFTNSTPHDQQGHQGRWTSNGFHVPTQQQMQEIRRVQNERRQQRFQEREARAAAAAANQQSANVNANVNSGSNTATGSANVNANVNVNSNAQNTGQPSSSNATNATNSNAQKPQQSAPQSTVPPNAPNPPNAQAPPKPTKESRKPDQGLPTPPHGKRTSQDARFKDQPPQDGFFGKTFNAFRNASGGFGFFGSPEARRKQQQDGSKSTGAKPKDYHGKTAGDFFSSKKGPESHEQTPKGPKFQKPGPKRPEGSNNMYEPSNLRNLVDNSDTSSEGSSNESLRVSDDYDHQFGYEFNNYSFSEKIVHNCCEVIPNLTLFSVFQEQCFTLEEVKVVLAEYCNFPVQNGEIPEQYFIRAQFSEVYACQLVDLMDFKIARTAQIQHDITLKKAQFLKALGGNESVEEIDNPIDVSRPPPGYAPGSRLSAENLHNHNAQFKTDSQSTSNEFSAENNAGFNSNNYNRNAGFNSNNYNQNQRNSGQNAGLNSNNLNRNNSDQNQFGANFQNGANTQSNPFVNFQRNNNRVNFQQDNYAGLSSNNPAMQFSANSNLNPITINGIQYVPTYTRRSR